MLADDQAPGSAAGIPVLNETGLHTGQLDPDPEAADFAIPGEDVAIGKRSEAVDDPSGQSGHMSSPEK